MKISQLIVVLSLVLGMVSCATKTEDIKLKGPEYYPLKVGSSRIYQVDTINYDNFKKKIDTVSNIFKEELVEKFVNLENDTVYRFELSKYNADKDQYIVFKSFERSVKDNYALEMTDNLNEVKMLFPISQLKTKGTSYSWNANMFNNGEPFLVKYISVFSTFNNGLNAYNDCVSVRMTKPIDDTLMRKQFNEVYAKNIGLVYKYYESTDRLVDDFPSGKKIIIRLVN